MWQWGFVPIGCRTNGRICMCLQAWIWGRTYPELSRRMRAPTSRPIGTQARHACRGPRRSLPERSLPEPWHMDNAPVGLTGETAAAWSSRCKAYCYSLGVTEDLLSGRKALRPAKYTGGAVHC